MKQTGSSLRALCQNNCRGLRDYKMTRRTLERERERERDVHRMLIKLTNLNCLSYETDFQSFTSVNISVALLSCRLFVDV